MRNERGITLLVLVISIIIMLILAGVVITYILGNTGIFGNAGRAKIMSKVEALDDTIKAYTLKAANFTADTKSDKFGHKNIFTTLVTENLQIIGKDKASSVIYKDKLTAKLILILLNAE